MKGAADYIFVYYLLQSARKPNVSLPLHPNLRWNPPLQNIVITQGNPGLPWVIFHVESTIDYFVCFSLIIWEFKT